MNAKQAIKILAKRSDERAAQVLAEEVSYLVRYPEVDGETTIYDWILAGQIDITDTPESIAEEWDDLSAQALGED